VRARGAVLVALVVIGAAAVARTAAAAEPLSNEWTVTRWAYPNAFVAIRAHPAPEAPKVARLRYFTEDGVPEVYLALERVRAGGQWWVRIRIPMRPNGRTGWVRRDALGMFHIVRTALGINRRAMRATLYRDGKRIWQSPVGVGRPSMPTPAGHFYIRERLRGFGATYGPVAFGTSAYSVLSDWPGGGVVGIHGTDEPGLIPGRPSHGCVRVPNDAVRRLARLMPLGTPVRVV
jgi:L,D-transpeptidase catalytic domain